MCIKKFINLLTYILIPKLFFEKEYGGRVDDNYSLSLMVFKILLLFLLLYKPNKNTSEIILLSLLLLQNNSKL